jgi:PilZ domain-containing protein
MSEFPKRPDRVPTCQPCTIARGDGGIVMGTLLNLSNAGFCVSAKCSLVEGERIEVRILGLGRLRGTIRWAKWRRAGGLLDI